MLDVPPAGGCTVPGVLFRAASENAWATLDAKEGEGHLYRRIETSALTDDGGEHRAITFEVEPSLRESFVPPAPSYLDAVRAGYDEHGLSSLDLQEAASGRSPGGPVDQLFVYGTLLRGEERHPVLVRHRVEGGEAATTPGSLLDLGPYPGLVLDGAAGEVVGEIYRAADHDAVFAELDEIETFRGFGAAGSIYRRAVVRVRTVAAGEVRAWTYVYAGSREGARPIPSGNWRSRASS